MTLSVRVLKNTTVMVYCKTSDSTDGLCLTAGESGAWPLVDLYAALTLVSMIWFYEMWQSLCYADSRVQVPKNVCNVCNAAVLIEYAQRAPLV